MKVKYVDLGKIYQDYKEEIIKKFDEISRQGMFVFSNELESFEKQFASYCGTKYAIGVGNGTDALFLVLKALGIKQGDEVITTPNSFIATAGAIAATGATPVFVDVSEDYNINPELIESAITEKTKAIMPVHLTGRLADMDSINKIAKKHNLFVIEDAAQAIGASLNNKKAGSFGDAGCFSLHPLKNLYVHGDGGVITTNSTELYEKLLKLRNHGLKNRDECEFFGYNSRLGAINAAIASIKLSGLDTLNNKKRQIALKYIKSLKSYVKTPSERENEKQVYQVFVISTEKRNELQKFLIENEIETKIHYPIPIHLQEAASHLGYKEGDFPAAEKQSKQILSLPIHPHLKDEEVDFVILKIKEFFNK